MDRMTKEELEESLEQVIDQLEDTELPIQKYHSLLHEKELIERRLKKLCQTL